MEFPSAYLIAFHLAVTSLFNQVLGCHNQIKRSDEHFLLCSLFIWRVLVGIKPSSEHFRVAQLGSEFFVTGLGTIFVSACEPSVETSGSETRRGDVSHLIE